MCDNLCVTKLYICDKVVCDKVVWDKVVCNKVVCDKVVCHKVVCDKVVCGGRGGGGTARGVQIQKQEPHTILWGTKNVAKKLCQKIQRAEKIISILPAGGLTCHG